MAGLLSPQPQMKMAALQTMLEKVQSVYGQVERKVLTEDQARQGKAEQEAPLKSAAELQDE